MERLAILVGARGRGSNMAALLRACADGTIPAEPFRVVAPRGGTDAAANAGTVEVTVVGPGEGYGDRLVAALAGATVVCLAGFTRLLPTDVLRAFPGRVLNVHPSLLPRHGGPGMYGLRVHEAVIASGDRESGCTIHLVTERYDEGRIVLQARLPVLAGDTPETLAARVLELEHRAYPEAVCRVLSGDLSTQLFAGRDSIPSIWEATPMEGANAFASPPSADPPTFSPSARASSFRTPSPTVPPSGRASLQGEPSPDEVVR